MLSIFEKPKPWSIDDFEKYRQHNVDFCHRELIPYINTIECCRILLRAPVKSGKREFAEYLALRDQTGSESSSCRINMFISAWHRAADDTQRAELAEHNLNVFSLNNKKNKEACIKYIKENIAAKNRLLIHLDECDHGSGSRQLLSSIWRLICDNNLCTTILYSATPEEAMFSKDFINESDADSVDEQYIELLEDFESTAVVIEYKPPPAFCGPERFLREGLVFNAHPFFEKCDATADEFCLSEQARQIIIDHQLVMSNPETANRNILLLRLSYSGNKVRGQSKHNTKAIYQFAKTQFPELADYRILFDKCDSFDIPESDLRKINGSAIKIIWSDKEYWRDLTTSRPYIIVYDQTCSRSTELACHNRIFATHDFRNTITYSVVSQAQERPNHYSTKYGDFQPIRIYGHRPTFELSAKLITYSDYMNRAYKIKTNSDPDQYQIIEISTGVVFDVYDTLKAAEYKMMDLGCFGIIPKLSSRIAGSVKKEAICLSDFIACDATTFDSIARPQIMARVGGETRFQNPFPTSTADIARRTDELTGKLKGNLRGYKLLDYQTDVKQSKWGFNTSHTIESHRLPLRITVCYDGEILGVGIRIQTGIELINRMTSFRSAYAAIGNPTQTTTQTPTPMVSITPNIEINSVISNRPMPLSSLNTRTPLKKRPTKNLECFRRNTILHHYKPSDNVGNYAIWIIREKSLYRCNSDGVIIDRTKSFKTINSWTRENLQILGKLTVNNNCYTNVKYKSNDNNWVLCDDMTIDAILTW